MQADSGPPTSTVIVGAQWGDEGKGRIVDVLAEKSDLVVRYQGGANAGHTVVVGEKKFKLHLIPSGVVRGKRSLIGAGVVVDLSALKAEMDELNSLGVDVNPGVLGIDYRAPIIIPSHKMLDGAFEAAKKSGKIGTTQRGIGPAYSDLASRTGLIFSDLLSPDWSEKLSALATLHLKILQNMFPDSFEPPADYADQVMWYSKSAGFFSRFAVDASLEISNAACSGKRILFEGAQGTMLDNSFGTYPYVTSSHPIAGGACVGAGVSPKMIGNIEGVAKAYCTRVGAGPFPTEIEGELGEKIRHRGGEYGTTTGRPRRVGWFDAVALRYANRLNGFSGLHITKLDVLGGLPQLKICDSYNISGKETSEYPPTLAMLQKAKPELMSLPGFESHDAQGWSKIARNGADEGFEALPVNALAFVKSISHLAGVPTASVSVGPERKSIIFPLQ
jgi:adenylosuccinate synthase